MYRIVEDHKRKYWVAKITKDRIVMNEGAWHWFDKLPNKPGHVLYLKDIEEGRTVQYNFHMPSIFI